MSATLPNFLLVGAAKSGTTSLYSYLRQHPQVFMSPVKEPLFFCSVGVEQEQLEKELYPLPLDEVVRDIDAYSQLFRDARHELVRGEASVYYMLDYEKTIANIQRWLPHHRQTKIVIILRNPIDASFSHYSMFKLYLENFRGVRDVPSFEESFSLESERIHSGYQALAHFHWYNYRQQVAAYLESFDQVLILFHSDLKSNRTQVIQRLYAFLGVDASFVPGETSEYNVSGIPKSQFAYRLLSVPSPMRNVARVLTHSVLRTEESRNWVRNRLQRWILTRSEMSPSMRDRLRDFYRDEIVGLGHLVGRDLTTWLQ